MASLFVIMLRTEYYSIRASRRTVKQKVVYVLLARTDSKERRLLHNTSRRYVQK